MVTFMLINSANPMKINADINPTIKKNITRISEEIDTFINNGSGWVLKSIDKLEIYVVNYKPLKGSSYIDLPNIIKHKKACINVKNNDQKCFAYAVVSAIHPINYPKDPTKVCYYKSKINELNMEGIQYPVSLENIRKYEKQNPKYGINVFVLEKWTSSGNSPTNNM